MAFRTYREVFAGAVVAIVLVASTAFAQGDPLPSWNDTPTKKAILSFVENVTKDGGPDFVPTKDRVAVFDMGHARP